MSALNVHESNDGLCHASAIVCGSGVSPRDLVLTERTVNAALHKNEARTYSCDVKLLGDRSEIRFSIIVNPHLSDVAEILALFLAILSDYGVNLIRMSQQFSARET